MNTYLRMTLVAGFMLGSATLFAQSKEDGHASHSHSATTTAPATTAAPVDAKHGPATASTMQDNMKQMQEQMAKINSSKDPAERKALLDQHMQTMHRQMEMMRSMMGKQGDDKEGSSTMNCGQMMGGNMDMMQMMMNQMQQHASAEEQVKPAK